MPDNFWPENIADSNLTTPVTILKKKARPGRDSPVGEG